jgi:DNA-binding transcriptional LysR family regulator
MTLEDLRVFNAVAEAESLSAVARRLGRTQPAVSQHVARLERELGVALLDRAATGVHLTAAGRLFYDASSTGLGALELAMREIQRARTRAAARLAISTGGTTVRHFMREAVVRFRQRHPQASIHFEPASSTPRCLEAVAGRRADLAFITIGDELPGFEQRLVIEMPLMLLVLRDDPLARRRVALRDLEGMRYIALSESTASHRFIHDHLAREGVTLTPVARVDDFDTANVFVELGLGHAIVPAVQGRDFEQSGRVQALPIRGLPPLPVGWAARRFQLLPPVAVEFMQIFLAAAGRWKNIPGLRVIKEPAPPGRS